MIVQFLAPVPVAGVAPVLVAHRMVHVPVGRDGHPVPFGLRVLEQGDNAPAFDVGGNIDPRELAEGRVDAQEIDRARTDRVGLGQPGHIPDQGGPSGFLPEGELAPALLFPEVPAMIPPQDDDGVVLVRALLEGIEQATDANVNEGDGREVGLDGILPAPAFEELGRSP